MIEYVLDGVAIPLVVCARVLIVVEECRKEADQPA